MIIETEKKKIRFFFFDKLLIRTVFCLPRSTTFKWKKCFLVAKKAHQQFLKTDFGDETIIGF